MRRAVASLVVTGFIAVGDVSVGAAAEAKYQTFDFNADVPAFARHTWLDLLRQALPDAKADPANPHAHDVVLERQKQRLAEDEETKIDRPRDADTNVLPVESR